MNTLLTLGAILLLVHVVQCIWFPWARCRRSNCEGGRVWNGARTAWRECRRCDGSGKRTRWGRIAYEMLMASQR